MQLRNIAALALLLALHDARATGFLSARVPAATGGTIRTTPLPIAARDPVVATPTAAPFVVNVVQVSGNRTYRAGETVTLKLDYNEAVVLDTTTGTPSVQLETGNVDRLALYAFGSGSASLYFDYVVQPGDGSADLQYLGTSAYSLGGATLVSVSTGDLGNQTLPGLASGHSLAETSAIVIDTGPLFQDGFE